MWPFRKQPEADLTTEAYAQWLRAGRPPLFWFMAQADDQREAMARLGDELEQARAIAIGYAVRDPIGAENGTAMAAGSADAEAEMVQRLAERAVGGILSRIPKPEAPPKPKPPVMRGTGRKVVK